MQTDLPRDAAALDTLLNAQRQAWLRAPYPAWETRAQHLKTLRAMLLDNADALAVAINADFGQRPKAETLLCELVMVRQEIDAALKHGARWMRTQRRSAGKWLMPGRARLTPQPLGVVGIVSPWNYPVLLAAAPLVGALAAGNRVLIKMPELAPRTSALFAELIGKSYAPDHVAVVNGDAAVGAAFTALPFNHLIFTGSTRVGHAVMHAAADNLTPVTLELGGKSPTIITPDMTGARFNWAVDNLLIGKTLNGGQTCIAPDYMLLPRGTEEAFIARAKQRVAQLYPDFAHNRDYTTIISPRHFARLQDLLRQAQAGGAQLHPLVDNVDPNDPALVAERRFVPTAITNAPADCALMQEELFGPLLPLVPYDTVDDALRYINARPRPLALYLYTDNRATIERFTRETISGGVSVNETLMHTATDALPFGGVGASGMGAYHGYDGFVTFSKMKPIFLQSRFTGRNMIAPPYGSRFDRLIGLMLRW